MINFKYDHSKITTQDDLTISVADLRDLLNCINMDADHETVDAELGAILSGINRKNRLESGTVWYENVANKQQKL